MSKESKEMISLENFNYEIKSQRLTSPLSIKACKLQGVTEEDFIYLTLEEYIHMHPESMNLPKEFQQERYDNFEQNRKDLIESLKETRNELKEEINKKEKKEQIQTEELYQEKTQSHKKANSLNKEEFRKKLKNELDENIKMLIEKEFEKEEKRRKRINRKIKAGTLSSVKLKQGDIFRENLTDENDRKLLMEIIQEKKQNDYKEKEEKKKKKTYLINGKGKKQNE